MAKKFEYMSQNEWLGDATTHFMKSGSALRSPANKDQESLSTYIPRMANGVKVEYDIAYDFPGKIHGYKFSDFLTKAVYLAPQNRILSRQNISQVASMTPSATGRKVIEALRSGIEDKYILDNDDEDFTCSELIVLPGTNVLNKDDMVDMDKVDRLVVSGAYVKLHPITEKTWCNYLKSRWKGKVIDADAPLYPILRNAKKVYFTSSSETGIASVIFGKEIGLINHPNKRAQSNFEHIYSGLDSAKNGTLLNKMSALFSFPESGMLTTYHDNPGERVEAFFQHMSQYPHK